MARRSRHNQPVEARLISEYIAMQFPECRTAQRVRVGKIPAVLGIPGLTPAEQRVAGVWRRWVDAVVWTPKRIIIIEATVYPDPGKVSQLDLYLRLFPQTAEFAEDLHTPLHGRLLFAIDDPTVRALARERGFSFVVYRPRWVEAYLAEQAPRRRRAPLSQL